ncbi:MAG: DUF3596 domain-containing protein [Hormoscilla sp. GM102CHS1]|nr:DUF3596 domain-containing protein [Hormoscilla sp. GM102CHS1]
MTKKTSSQKRNHRYKGKVGVRSFQGMLSLRLPRFLFGGQQKIISLRLQDNPTNRKQAEFKAREIDIDKGDFDQTLNRYGLREKLRSHPDDDKVIPVSLAKLYEKYITSCQDMVKPSTWTISY